MGNNSGIFPVSCGHRSAKKEKKENLKKNLKMFGKFCSYSNMQFCCYFGFIFKENTGNL